MNKKRILSLLLAVGMLLGMFPMALAAWEDEDLERLTWDNVSWDETDGVEVDVDTNTPLLYWYETPEENGNWIEFYTEYDQYVEAEQDITFTCPDVLVEQYNDNLAIRYERFRPGDKTGETNEGYVVENLEDGSYTITVSELDGPWMYVITFGAGTDEDNFIPYTYPYSFRLSIKTLEWLERDNVTYEITSGTLEESNRWPETRHLFINGSDYNNWYQLYMEKENAAEPASAEFSIHRPHSLSQEDNLVAQVDGEIVNLIRNAVTVEVTEDNSVSTLIQFGVLDENDHFVPLTYEYPFSFDISVLDHLTWDNIECVPVNGYSDRIYRTPDEDEPLNVSWDHGEPSNWIDLYVVPDDAESTVSANFTITPPDSLAALVDSGELYVKYWSFVRGTSHQPSETEYIEVPRNGHSIQIPVEDDKIYSFTFGTKDEDDYFMPKTYEYRFGVDIKLLEKLTWDNIQVILPKGAELGEVTRNPESGDLYRPQGGTNVITVPVLNAQEGDKVTFKIICPAEDTRHVIGHHTTFIQGLQSNPDVKYDEYTLDSDGAFTVDVDLIGAADSTKVIHSLAFRTEDSELVTDYYHFVFEAKTSGVTVTATPSYDGEESVSATVPSNAISDAIVSNPDESTIYVDAGSDFPQDIIEANVTLDSADVNKITEEEVTLQVATPVGTVTLPAEVIQQAKGDSENTEIILNVRATESESVTYQNITVENAEKVEVTLYRVVDGGEPEAIPIRMTGSKAVTVSVVTMQEPTLNKPVYVVYLPEQGAPVLEKMITSKDSNSRVTFTTSHLSEFALLSYEEAVKLGLVSTPSDNTPSDTDTGSYTRPSRPKKDSSSSSSKDDDKDNTNAAVPDSEPIAPSTPAVNTSFLDVPSTEWYAASVAFVSENGMMAGSNGYFTPNSNLTRAMLAQILSNMEGSGSAGASQSFPDVSAGDWFSGAVSQAVSMGFMNGYGSGLFGPNDPITREQLAVVFYNYALAKGYNTSASGDLSVFTDSAAVSDWAAAAVRWAVGSGLISGKSGGRLDPAGTATRAEVAQILMNFKQNIAK